MPGPQDGLLAYEAFVYPDDAIGFTVELIQPHTTSWNYPDETNREAISAKMGLDATRPMHYPGHVFTRSQLLDEVWGYGHDGYEHTVNSHINRLRNKIEANPDRPRLILFVATLGIWFWTDAINASSSR